MRYFDNGYALLVGIANYLHLKKLPETVLKDARDLSLMLGSHERCAYRKDHVRLLSDVQADVAGIRNGFEWLIESCGKEDTCVIFISSHGGRIETGPQAGNYLLPFDFTPAHIKETAISADELTQLMRGIKARRFLALFDFCYSGGTGEAKNQLTSAGGLKSELSEDAYDRLAQGTGRVIMASSRSTEESFVLPGMKNSLFTHYLLEAFDGKALSRGDGLLRVFDIFHYVADNIKTHGHQHPIFKAADLEDNFPIALCRGGDTKVGRYIPAPPVTDQVDKRELREAVVRYFSRDELDLLCADIQQDLVDNGIKLQVNLDVVGGGNLAVQALNLINYLDRRGYLEYLILSLRQSRPGIMCII